MCVRVSVSVCESVCVDLCLRKRERVSVSMSA